MTTVTIEQAQADLSQLLDQLESGGEVVITRQEQPVGKLVRLPEKKRPIAGRGRGKVIIHSDDDRHLEDFADYMPTDAEIQRLQADKPDGSTP